MPNALVFVCKKCSLVFDTKTLLNKHKRTDEHRKMIKPKKVVIKKEIVIKEEVIIKKEKLDKKIVKAKAKQTKLNKKTL